MLLKVFHRFRFSASLDVVKESDEEYIDSSRQRLLPNFQQDLSSRMSDSVVRPEETQDEKRPTIKAFMELFSNEPDSLKGDEEDEEAGPKTNEVSTTSDEAEQLPLDHVSRKDTRSSYSPAFTEHQSEASVLSHTASFKVDPSQGQDSIGTPAGTNHPLPHRHQSMSEKEAQGNRLPSLKFSLGGKRRSWSVPDSVSRWRKRRTKKNPSFSETTDQLPSESESEIGNTTSPLLSDETDSGDKNKKSSEKISVESRETLKFESIELESPDFKQRKLKPNENTDRTSSGKKESRFDVSESSSKRLPIHKDQDSEKSINSGKSRSSRFTVSPS